MVAGDANLLFLPAKVIFLHLSVIHSVHGGVCLSACWDTPLRDQADTPPGPGRHPPQNQADPPGTRQTPPDQADTPPGPGRPPQTRQTPPWDQADTPPRTRQTPPGKQTPAYGLRAAGTHPTGKHSSFR